MATREVRANLDALLRVLPAQATQHLITTLEHEGLLARRGWEGWPSGHRLSDEHVM